MVRNSHMRQQSGERRDEMEDMDNDEEDEGADGEEGDTDEDGVEGEWESQRLLGTQTLVRIYRARLPYLTTHELRWKEIAPPSSTGVGTARHHWPPR